MSILNLFKEKSSELLVVVFDIGSGSVGAALTVFSEDKAPTILYKTRIPIAYQKHLRFDRLLKAMLAALNSAAEDIEKSGALSGRKVENILCVFSSPWFVHQTKVLKLERKKPFTLTAASIGKIIARADKHFRKSDALNDKTGKDGNVVLIEKHIISVALNGYITHNPYGKRARQVEIALYLSMISDELHEKTKEVLKRTFNIDDISFHSFALASFSAIRDIFHSERDFMIIDVSGEITDISLVRDGVLLETVSFPLGKNFLLRSVTETLNTIPEEAHSLIRGYLENKGDGKETKRLEKALAAAKEKWLTSLRRALTDLSDGLVLPRIIFLTVDSDIGAWFGDTIKRDDFSTYTLAEASFSVIAVKGKQLQEHVSITRNVPDDPFLALEAIFFHKVLHG